MSDFQDPVFTEEENKILDNAKPSNDVKEERKPNEASLIPIGPDGKVMARDNAELMRYCAASIQGESIPERFNTPHKLFAALMYVRDLKLPDTAIRQVANIHGTMCTFGDLPLSMAQNTGKLKIREQWFDIEYNIICFENKNLTNKVFGAVCFLSRDDGPEQSFSYTLEDAERAGQYPPMKAKWVNRQKVGTEPNPDSPWEKHFRMMMRYKARTIGLKSLFADAINGLAIAEYDFDELPSINGDDYRDVTPTDQRDAARSKIDSVLGGTNGQA
jgi:hypothetical protein